jgi:hypothetical protein
MSYRQLDSAKIVSTIEILNQRIVERFPASGLSKVAQELLTTGQEANTRSQWVAKPLWHFRFLIGILVTLIAVSLFFVLTKIDLRNHPLTFAEFIQVLESAINDIVFFGLGIFFIATLETRIKRQRVVGLLHDLRAMAHVIDMHQLTKDPESLLTTYQQTKSSPTRTMSAFELERYLDYCSEMLSLISKIAALYVQDFNDTEVVDVVNEIESLTTGLSRKMWQKIRVLQSFSLGQN